MPLPLPNLDNRQWVDLVDEGQALIPRYAPDWTDHNVHDPGITLMELFAWLSEMTMYQLNRVPERHLRKFLALLGYFPLPPQAAQTVISFTPDEGTDPFDLPEGVEFESAENNQPSVLFSTLRELTVAFVELNAMQFDKLDPWQAPGVTEFFDLTRDWRDGLPITPLGPDSQSESAWYLGFDFLPTETPVTLAIQLQGPGIDGTVRKRLIQEAAQQLAACQPVRPDISCEGALASPPMPSAELPPHHSVEHVWEVLTSTDPEEWTPLEYTVSHARPEVGQVMDDTRSLTLNGIVEFNLPASLERAALGQVTEALFYLRCRLTAGSHDTSPVITKIATNGVYAEQAVQVPQTFEIAAGVNVNGTEPDEGNQVQSVRLEFTVDNNGVIQTITFHTPATAPDNPDVLAVEYVGPTAGTAGRIVLLAELAGIGNGRPDQQVILAQAQVQIASVKLYTHLGNNWQRWNLRHDFDASSRTDFDVVINATDGELTFGNGNRGRVVPAEAPILAIYRTTQGEAGNLGIGSVTRLAESTLNDALLTDTSGTTLGQLQRITTNQLSVTGGADMQPLMQTIGDAVETLHAHQRLSDLCAETNCTSLDDVGSSRAQSLRAPTRGVNLLDIERLAMDVPGTRIARARAWPASHPSYPCLQAEGVITVAIIPDQPVPRPEPSAGLLEVIKRYLNRRRIVTTRLEVIGPQYLAVSVFARVRTRPHIDVDRVHQQIVKSVNAFLDPREGGPENQGWPFGRSVLRSEVLHLLDEVAGVDHVLELSLKSPTTEPLCGNLTVCPTWLVTPGVHQIEVIRGEM